MISLNYCPKWLKLHYAASKLGTKPQKARLHASHDAVHLSPRIKEQSCQNYISHPRSFNPPLKWSSLEEHSKDLISHNNVTVGPELKKAIAKQHWGVHFYRQWEISITGTWLQRAPGSARDVRPGRACTDQWSLAGASSWVKLGPRYSVSVRQVRHWAPKHTAQHPSFSAKRVEKDLPEGAGPQVGFGLLTQPTCSETLLSPEGRWGTKGTSQRQGERSTGQTKL